MNEDVRIIEVRQSIFADNDAERLRGQLISILTVKS